MWVYIEPEGDEAIWKRKDAAGKGETHRGELNWSFSRAGKGIKDLLNINAGIKSAKAETQENTLFWGMCTFQKNPTEIQIGGFLWKLHNESACFDSKFVQIAQKGDCVPLDKYSAHSCFVINRQRNPNYYEKVFKNCTKEFSKGHWKSAQIHIS